MVGGQVYANGQTPRRALPFCRLVRRSAYPTLRDNSDAQCVMSAIAWREVGFAGMIGGDRRAMVMVSHQGIDRREVLDVLQRRWPDVLIKKPAREEPTWEMLPADAAELGRCRRGVEPMRLTVMPQHERKASISSLVGSMPALVG